MPGKLARQHDIAPVLAAEVRYRIMPQAMRRKPVQRPRMLCHTVAVNLLKPCLLHVPYEKCPCSIGPQMRLGKLRLVPLVNRKEKKSLACSYLLFIISYVLQRHIEQLQRQQHIIRLPAFFSKDAQFPCLQVYVPYIDPYYFSNPQSHYGLVAKEKIQLGVIHHAQELLQFPISEALIHRAVLRGLSPQEAAFP